MKLDYQLAESVIVVQGTIDRVTDSKAETFERDYGVATADIVLTVRGDTGAGAKDLTLPEGGDNEFTVELTSDQRFSAVTYKSVGIGSRVLAAATTIVATIAGVLLRASAPTTRLLRQPGAVEGGDVKDAEAKARDEWDKLHLDLAEHKKKYTAILRAATKGLLKARDTIVTSTDPNETSRAVAQVYRLETVAAAAQNEVEKIDGLYNLWREKFRIRRTQKFSYTLPADGLLKHKADAEVPNVTALPSLDARLWEELGVLVEIGPADGWMTVDRIVSDQDPRSDRVWWRVPRPVRLWVWRRGDDDQPSLERTFEAAIVDRNSATLFMDLNTRVFGEAGGSITFDSMGAPTKLTRNDKSGLGAFVDALGAAPANIAAGLDSASKIATSWTSLADAGAERELAVLKRQVEAHTKRLELKGLDATAGDFAELKRLEQQVLLAAAKTTLDPELAQVKAELSLVTARKDLDTAVRQHALDVELAGAQAEITRLTTELKLAKARKGEVE